MLHSTPQTIRGLLIANVNVKIILESSFNGIIWILFAPKITISGLNRKRT